MTGMNSDEKLRHFDPTDADAAQQLAYAALELAEQIQVMGDLGAPDRWLEPLYLNDKVACALKLHQHPPQAGRPLEPAPDIRRRILKS